MSPRPMSPDEMIAVVPCETAEELLDEMSPARGRLWARARDAGLPARDWIFRGVAQADFPLRPSALREDAFAPFHGLKTYRVDRAEGQRAEEDATLAQFFAAADQMGVPVPSDRPELRDPRAAAGRLDPHEFPPIAKLHMFALAQHYGVPTRLLDWTTRPLVAVYFAVERVAKLRAGLVPEGELDLEAPCALWALDQDFLRMMASQAIADPSIDPAVFVVTAPTATNPNLAAQGGLFTLVQPRSGDPHPIADLDDAIRRMAGQVPEEHTREAPFLVQFVLPSREARTALRLLAVEGVNAGTVRPGLAGIVDTLRERWAHQWAPRGKRD